MPQSCHKDSATSRYSFIFQDIGSRTVGQSSEWAQRSDEMHLNIDSATSKLCQLGLVIYPPGSSLVM